LFYYEKNENFVNLSIPTVLSAAIGAELEKI